jgi:hypothetical protein
MNYEKNLLDFYVKYKGQYEVNDVLWYSNMSTIIRSNGGDFRRNCAIFALMSINTSLTSNIKKFDHYIETGEFRGLFPDKFIKIQKAKSEEDLLTALNGNKVKNFFMNLYNPVDPKYVTIDRWAYRVAGFQGKPTNKRYIEVANAYKTASNKLGLLPNQLQSCTWCAIRKI